MPRWLPGRITASEPEKEMNRKAYRTDGRRQPTIAAYAARRLRRPGTILDRRDNAPNLLRQVVDPHCHPFVDRLGDHRDDELERRREHRIGPDCLRGAALSGTAF